MAWWMWRLPSSYLVLGEYWLWGRNWAAEGFFLWANLSFGSRSFRPLHKHIICRVLLDLLDPPRNPSVVLLSLILVLRMAVSLLSLSPLAVI